MRALILVSTLVSVWILGGCAGHAHYSGLQTREIKSLSAADMAGYREGRGMSMALAAELNGYPGPLHVLELADQLALSPEQLIATRQLHERMTSSAIRAGEVLIAAERELDRLFASRSAREPRLHELLARVADAQARLRGVHLQTHLEQVRILRSEQVDQYNKLRGYGG